MCTRVPPVTRRVCGIEAIIEMLAVLIVGPLVGSEFAVAAFANPIVGRLPDQAFRAARSDGGRLLGKVMPFWYIAALVLLVGATVIAHSRLIGAAAVLLAVTVVLSVAMLVPINNRIAAWSGDGPADGDSIRELAARWDRLHWLRVVILAVVFVLLVVGAL